VKYLKRINEGWSDDYVTDFSDNGFTIEETPSNIKGSISKGTFLVTDLNNWFTEMTDKLSDDYKVLTTKTFFNEITGRANFEVVVTETDLENVYINVDGTDIQFIPKTIIYVSTRLNYHLNGIESRSGDFSIKGRLSNGLNKTLLISFKWKDDFKEVNFSLSNKSRGVTMTKENMEKIFTLFDSGQVKFYTNPTRSDLENLRIIRTKISE
jgi:hypothetical protein